MPTSDALSLAQARRIALAAQGFAQPRPHGPVTRRHLRRVAERLGVVQIDSVNVLVRSHFLPFHARLGDYDPALLERGLYGPRRTRDFFEYWGHEASLLPLALHPLLRWRMARAARGEGAWARPARFLREHRPLLDAILARIAAEGPLSAGAFENGRGSGTWWGWSDAKIALEALFWTGEVTTATRVGFERRYDLTARVIPPEILALPTPPEPDAQRELVRIAARALGVAAERDLRDYFRLDLADARARVAELVAAAELRPVTVEGQRQTYYLHRDARLPRRIAARALLSPFDNLIWERSRTRALFGFDFRLEIYTPQQKRVHGYYVLPLLLGDALVARVDLKHDRAARALRVLATHLEPGVDAAAVREALAAELAALAAWLGAERVAADCA